MQPVGVPGAQQYQAQIEGLKALANLVEVSEATFRLIVRSHEHPTIVAGGTGALWFKKHTYLTTYDGFVFCLRSERPLDFAADAPGAFFVEAKTVHIPFL
ncbi:MAG: hypothetical protein ACYTEZ_06185 [Planctomycetota bacterium]